MAGTFRIIGFVAAVGLLAGCETGNDFERAGLGAATGAVVAGATGNNVATGAAIGAAAGALADDAARAVRN